MFGVNGAKVDKRESLVAAGWNSYHWCLLWIIWDFFFKWGFLLFFFIWIEVKPYLDHVKSLLLRHWWAFLLWCRQTWSGEGLQERLCNGEHRMVIQKMQIHCWLSNSCLLSENFPWLQIWSLLDLLEACCKYQCCLHVYYHILCFTCFGCLSFETEPVQDYFCFLFSYYILLLFIDLLMTE